MAQPDLTKLSKVMLDDAMRTLQARQERMFDSVIRKGSSAMAETGSKGLRPFDRWDPQMAGTSAPGPATLTVEDVVKLAAAGVAVKFEDVADRLRPSGEPKAETLIDVLVQRWRTSKKANRDPFGNAGEYEGFNGYAIRHGETVYVFVQAGASEPVIIEDPAYMYPSDGLMAAIHLLIKTPPCKPVDTKGDDRV